MIGRTVSHFRIESSLGQGGMGDVYLAEDLILGRKVAVKFISNELACDSTALTRFRREARSAAELSHPNIAAIHEIGEDGGRPFLVLEYVPGETIADRVARGPLPPSEIIQIGKVAAEALACAHARNIIHRDVKSANIMLTPEGTLKLLDLGLARRLESTKMTESGVITGTMSYMSPEQATGRPADARSDLWSLGVVLYQCATARLPFDAETSLGAMHRIVHDSAVAPGVLRPGIPPDLERIILRCLEKDPDHRYQHADDLVSELKALANRFREPYRTDSGESRTGRPVAARSFLLRKSRPLLVFLLLLSLAGAAWFISQKTAIRDLGERSVVVVDFRDLTNLEDPTLSAGLTGLVHLSLTQSSPCRVVSLDLVYDLRRRLFGATKGPIEEDQALELARKSGATTLLAGRIGASSGKPFVMWRLVDVKRGVSLGSRRQEGSEWAVLADRVVADVLPLLLKECNVQPRASVVPVNSLTTTSPEAYRNYVAGMQALEEQRGSQAIRAFQRAVTLDSTFALAYFGLSRINWIDSPTEERLAAADRAWQLRAHLGDKDQLCLEAWRLSLQGNAEAATSQYRAVLSRWPDDRTTLVELSEMLFTNWCNDEAMPILEGALVQYPEDVRLQDQKTSVLRHLGRFPEAFQSAQASLRISPGNPNSWDDLGLGYLDRGLPDSAEAAFRKALALDPGFLYSRGHLANAFYARGDLDGAIELIEQLLKAPDLQPQQRVITTKGWFGLAMAYAEAGRLNEASEALDRIQQELSRSRIAADFRKTQIYLWLGMAEPALRSTRQILTAGGDFALGEKFNLYCCQALALADLDSVDAARVSLENAKAAPAISECYERSVLSFVSARVLIAEGKIGMALNALEEYQLHYSAPDESRIRCQTFISRAQRLAGRPDEAIKTLRSLLRVHGGHALAHFELGQIYEEMRQPENARTEYGTFLRMWHRADETLPQLGEARRRQEALSRRRG